MKATTRIAVVGAGVAGSFLAFLLSRVRGLKIDVFEPYEVYCKPCGEAIPATGYSLLKGWGVDVEKKPVRAMVVCIGSMCRTIDFGYDVGYIINKQQMIKRLRSVRKKVHWHKDYAKIEKLIQKYDVVVDARGPYSDVEEYDSIVAVQGYIDDLDMPGFTGSNDTIHFWFDTHVMGYAWAFPSVHHGEWNIGFGMRAREYRHYYKHIGLKELLKIKLNLDKEPVAVNVSKIKIVDPKHAITPPIIRIGEAGGFIVPFTGEGIRPALESAKALFEDLVVGEGFNTLRRLAKQYKKHHILYRLLRLIGPKIASRVLLKADAQTFIDLLNGRISLYKLFRLLV